MRDKVESFMKRKQEKDGVVTAEDVLNMLLDEVDDIESIMIVSEHKGGQIKTHCSCESGLKAIGLSEAGKQALFATMY